MARYVGTAISRKTFNDLEDLMRSFQVGSQQFNAVADVAAELLAHTTKGYAERYYLGPATRPSDARRSLGAPAWTIPVRRLTGHTFAGWQVKRVGPGMWQTFNDERGAFMVEHGIVRGGGGVRRPILKLSIVKTLRMAAATRMGTRLMADTLGNLRNNKGQFQSTTARIRRSSIIGSMAGPKGRLPG